MHTGRSRRLPRAVVKTRPPSPQSLRRGSSVFAGKHGFITLRDLFRWADRYRLEQQTEASRDWLQHLADDGEALSPMVAGRSVWQRAAG